MNLSLISIDKDGTVRIASESAITSADLPGDGANPLAKLLGQNWATMRVMLNFEKTPYIDSSAVGWLIGSQRSFKAANGMLVLYSVTSSVRQILDLLRVGRYVPMAMDEDAARNILLEGSGS